MLQLLEQLVLRKGLDSLGKNHPSRHNCRLAKRIQHNMFKAVSWNTCPKFRSDSHDTYLDASVVLALQSHDKPTDFGIWLEDIPVL